MTAVLQLTLTVALGTVRALRDVRIARVEPGPASATLAPLLPMKRSAAIGANDDSGELALHELERACQAPGRRRIRGYLKPILPPRLRVLFVASAAQTGQWLAEALESDSATKVELSPVVGATAALARLRDEAFDAVLVGHDPGRLDGLEMVEALRAGGHDEPVVVLGDEAEIELDPLCHEVGADGYLCVHDTTIRNLLWTLARGVQRQLLTRENRRLAQVEHNRLRAERQDAQRLLDEQRQLVEQWHNASTDDSEAEALAHVPTEIVAHYRDLLRAYVIMGCGHLGPAMQRPAELMSAAGVTAPQMLDLHVQVLEELLQGLGGRSARHVLNRADLLVLEMTMHLAEVYRQRATALPS